MRFVVVSTHHESVYSAPQVSISGSPTTHEDCIAALKALGATVLAEHGVFESFSGDGLIVASFAAADRSIALPRISRNVRQKSLFAYVPDGHTGNRVSSIAQAKPPRGWLRRQIRKLRRSCRKRLLGRADRRVA